MLIERLIYSFYHIYYLQTMNLDKDHKNVDSSIQFNFVNTFYKNF